MKKAKEVVEWIIESARKLEKAARDRMSEYWAALRDGEYLKAHNCAVGARSDCAAALAVLILAFQLTETSELKNKQVREIARLHGILVSEWEDSLHAIEDSLSLLMEKAL